MLVTHPFCLTVSALGWIIIVFLAFGEIGNYMHPRVSEHMRVDSTALGEQLQVNINITFHALTCNEVHLDVMDIAGDNQLNVEHDMLKQRVSQNGRAIGRAGIEIIGEVRQCRVCIERLFSYSLLMFRDRWKCQIYLKTSVDRVMALKPKSESELKYMLFPSHNML